MPADVATLARIRNTAELAGGSKAGGQQLLDQLFLCPSHSLAQYQLECCLAMVLPASSHGQMTEKSFELQLLLVRGGMVPLLLNMISGPAFLAGADLETRKAALLAVLRLS